MDYFHVKGIAGSGPSLAAQLHLNSPDGGTSELPSVDSVVFYRFIVGYRVLDKLY